MYSSLHVVFLVASLVLMSRMAEGQRPYYAGSRPIGVPEVADRFLTDEDRVNQASAGVGNRFGQGNGSGTTQRIPVDANGDYDLINRISQWPVDQQPYWFINWQHIEASRNRQQQQQANAIVDQRPSVNSRGFFAG